MPLCRQEIFDSVTKRTKRTASGAVRSVRLLSDSLSVGVEISTRDTNEHNELNTTS